MLSESQQIDLLNKYGHHKPKDEQQGACITLNRREFYRLAAYLAETLSEGREKACAMTKLEEASFWANAATSRAWGKAEPLYSEKPDAVQPS